MKKVAGRKQLRLSTETIRLLANNQLVDIDGAGLKPSTALALTCPPPGQVRGCTSLIDTVVTCAGC